MTNNQCQHGQLITQFCIAQSCSQVLSSGCFKCINQYHSNHYNQSSHKKSIVNIQKINTIINSFTVQAAKPKCRSLQQAILSTIKSIKYQISNFLDNVGKKLINKIGYPYLSKQNQLSTFKRLKNKQYKKVSSKQLRDFCNFAQILNKSNQWIKKQNLLYAQEVKKILPFVKELQQHIFSMKMVIEKFQILQSKNSINTKQDFEIQKIQELINYILNRKQNNYYDNKNITPVSTPPINQNNELNTSKNSQNAKTLKIKNKTTKQQSSLFDKKSQFLDLQNYAQKNQKILDKSSHQNSKKYPPNKNYVVHQENIEGSNRSRKFTQYDKKVVNRKQNKRLKKQKSAKVDILANDLSTKKELNQTKRRKPSIEGAIDIIFGNKKENNIKLVLKKQQKTQKMEIQEQNSQANSFQNKRKQALNSSNKGLLQGIKAEEINESFTLNRNFSNKSQTNDFLHTLLPVVGQKQSSSSFNQDVEKVLSQKTIIVEIPTHTKDDYQNIPNKPKNINRNFSLIKNKSSNSNKKNEMSQQDDELLYKSDEEKSLLCYIKALTVSQAQGIKYLQSALIYSKSNLSAAQYLSYLYLKLDRIKDCYEVCCNIWDKIRHSKEGPEIGVNIIINKTAALNILGRYSQTIKIIQKYLVYKKHEKLYKNYADALNFLGKYHEAIKNYQIAIKINENYQEACYNLAVCYFNLQHYLMAKTMILKSLVLDGNNQNYLQLKNQIFLKIKPKE